jgi:hypothetical protein
MQPLNGAGLDAHAYISYHYHTANGSVITLDTVSVLNNNDALCGFYWTARDTRSGALRTPGHNTPCGQSAEINLFVTNDYGTVNVTVYNYSRNGDYTFHNLALRDF